MKEREEEGRETEREEEWREAEREEEGERQRDREGGGRQRGRTLIEYNTIMHASLPPSLSLRFVMLIMIICSVIKS